MLVGFPFALAIGLLWCPWLCLLRGCFSDELEPQEEDDGAVRDDLDAALMQEARAESAWGDGPPPEAESSPTEDSVTIVIDHAKETGVVTHDVVG